MGIDQERIKFVGVDELSEHLLLIRLTEIELQQCRREWFVGFGGCRGRCGRLLVVSLFGYSFLDGRIDTVTG